MVFIEYEGYERLPFVFYVIKRYFIHLGASDIDTFDVTYRVCYMCRRIFERFLGYLNEYSFAFVCFYKIQIIIHSIDDSEKG